MNNAPRQISRWLCEELFLIDGVFNEDGTAVTGHPNPHGAAVLNEGSGAPAVIRVPLATRHDWEAIKKRLKEEGF
jgi:hypothetical protein